MYSFVFLSLMTTKCASFSHMFRSSQGKRRKKSGKETRTTCTHPIRNIPNQIPDDFVCNLEECVFMHLKSTAHNTCASVWMWRCMYAVRFMLYTASQATITIHYRILLFWTVSFCEINKNVSTMRDTSEETICSWFSLLFCGKRLFCNIVFV